MPALDFVVRPASVADVDVIARHRAEMFRDIHGLDDARCAELLRESHRALEPLLCSGEYLGWLVSPADDPGTIVGGAGIRLRAALPSVRKRGGVVVVTSGRQGLIVNVYAERAWRRRGIAALVMRELLEEVKRLELASIVLHASVEGRALYESLGFVATNEMRYEGPPLAGSRG
jgi:GNAT superfamily N-acetyltransferase